MPTRVRCEEGKFCHTPDLRSESARHPDGVVAGCTAGRTRAATDSHAPGCRPPSAVPRATELRDRPALTNTITHIWGSKRSAMRPRSAVGRAARCRLYCGVPMPRRSSPYSGVLPDKISIFRGPITRLAAGDADRLRREVRHVVLHEIAHHFGISDERSIELDRY